MTTRRCFTALATTTSLLVALAMPAGRARMPSKEKRVKAGGVWAGTVARYADDGRAFVTMTATDGDTRRGRCTETWVDYRTKPHHHLNPGLLINCSGGTRRVSHAVKTDYEGVVGMSVAVCSVPDTSGPIRRSRANCRGGVSGIHLHSGQRYEQFRVEADDFPSGVRIWRG
jgi:hypothetical protein